MMSVHRTSAFPLSLTNYITRVFPCSGSPCTWTYFMSSRGENSGIQFRAYRIRLVWWIIDIHLESLVTLEVKAWHTNCNFCASKDWAKRPIILCSKPWSSPDTTWWPGWPIAKTLSNLCKIVVPTRWVLQSWSSVTNSRLTSHLIINRIRHSRLISWNFNLLIQLDLPRLLGTFWKRLVTRILLLDQWLIRAPITTTIHTVPLMVAESSTDENLCLPQHMSRLEQNWWLKCFDTMTTLASQLKLARNHVWRAVLSAQLCWWSATFPIFLLVSEIHWS